MRWWWSIAIVAGCGPSVDAGQSGGSSSEGSSTSPTTTAVTTTATSSTGTSTTTGVDTSTGSDPSTATSSDESSTSIGFIQDPDGGCVGSMCDVWAQDCPQGEKCVPWSVAGDGSFDGCTDARCSELAEDPRQVGETCSVEDGPWSGVDDCELGAYCWNVDAQTNQGVCVAHCVGSEADPICEDAALSCFRYAGTSVTACVPACDPLAPACPAAMTCAMSVANDYAPLCISQSLLVPTGTGTECTYHLGCGDGFACIDDALVAGCTRDSCCAPLCDLLAPDCPPEHPVCMQTASTAKGVGVCVLGE